MQVSMSINGEAQSHDVEPRMLLVHYIREMAELHGTHWGCDTSNCGICVVLMNGVPIKSCTTLAAQAEGQEITTVEGLEKNGVLDPIQQGFHEMHALQCGFCTPGFLTTIAAGLDARDPSEEITDEEVDELVGGNLCRCTGYANIKKAVRHAAAAMGESRHEDDS